LPVRRTAFLILTLMLLMVSEDMEADTIHEWLSAPEVSNEYREHWQTMEADTIHEWPSALEVWNEYAMEADTIHEWLSAPEVWNEIVVVIGGSESGVDTKSKPYASGRHKV
jgi:hypothetical protein